MGTLGRLIIIIIEYGVFKVHTTYTIRIVAYTLVDSDQTESDRNFVTSTRVMVTALLDICLRNPSRGRARD